jgi:uncharacterized protein (DUF302 family)
MNWIALGISVGLGIAVSQGLGARRAIAQTTPSPSPANGLVIKASPHSVAETERRFVQLLEAKGVSVFATLDHAQNAANVDMELAPTRLLIFGNPVAGTPLMQCQQTIGIDLPLKVLIFADDQGVKIAYNEPRYLADRHGLADCGSQAIANLTTLLNHLSDQAIAP